MIAPIRHTADVPESRAMRRARRVVAATLLQTGPQPPEHAPPVRARKAWAFSGWVAAVTVLYVLHMIGVL